MTTRALPPQPPQAVMEQLRRRFSASEMLAIEALIALRTAAQQADNMVTEWLSGTAGSPARFQILAHLWAANASAVPHKALVDWLGVTRATVSGLMAGLERDGLARSSVDRDDRRKLLATLTPKGETVISKALAANNARLTAAFETLSAAELKTFTALLHRVREGFAAGDSGPRSDDAGRLARPGHKVRSWKRSA